MRYLSLLCVIPLLLALNGCCGDYKPEIYDPAPSGMIRIGDSLVSPDKGLTVYDKHGQVLGVIQEMDCEGEHSFIDGAFDVGYGLKRPKSKKLAWYSGRTLNGFFVPQNSVF